MRGILIAFKYLAAITRPNSRLLSQIQKKMRREIKKFGARHPAMPRIFISTLLFGELTQTKQF
jgi:hypothetical protein